MDDRELLELAAKAAGYQVEWVKNSGCYYRCEEEIGREQWDPLEDDGDAFRLAVKLRISVVFVGGVVDARYAGGVCHETFGLADPSPELIRRAIVRAAAAIGMAM